MSRSRLLPEILTARLTEIGAAAAFGERRAPDGSLTRENFSRWFADSCLVDEMGRPLVFMHGTAVPGKTFDAPQGELPAGAFTVFDRERLGSVTESSDSRSGFWFTSSAARAWSAASDAQAVAGDGHSTFVHEVYLRVRWPLLVGSIRDADPAGIARLARRAQATGHDGLVFLEGEDGLGSDVLVFGPQQIKSVLNSGAFRCDSVDIVDAPKAPREADRPAPRRERMRG